MPVHLVADVVFSGRGIATTFGCSLKFIKGEVFIKRSRIVIGRVYYRLVIVFELRFMTEKLCGLICRCRPVADIYYIVRHKVAVTSHDPVTQTSFAIRRVYFLLLRRRLVDASRPRHTINK